jgi:nucleoside-diphosphate-sugar epimerase
MITKHGVPAVDLEHILKHTPEIWPTFQDSRIFITGGTGFVGKWLLESLIFANERLSLNIQAVVLTRNPERFAQQAPHLANNQAISLHPGDIRDFQFPSGKFTHVIHGATDVSAAQKQLETYDVIVDGTKRILDFCKEHAIRDILLISSGAVYGRQPPELRHVSEQYMGAPSTHLSQTAYGQGKRIAEWFAAVYAAEHGIHCRIARCFAFAGPHLPLDAHFALGNFVADAIRGKTIEINGDGSPMRSYLYAADMTIWLWTILARGRPGIAYNVGSEEDISIQALASRIATLSTSKKGSNIRHPNTNTGLPERYVPSTQLATESLNLQAWIPLDEALSRMIDWARNNIDTEINTKVV